MKLDTARVSGQPRLRGPSEACPCAIDGILGDCLGHVPIWGSLAGPTSQVDRIRIARAQGLGSPRTLALTFDEAARYPLSVLPLDKGENL